MPAGKKANAKAAEQVVEETKVNAARAGKSQSKSPAPISNKKAGKFESAPEPILQVRGRTKQALHDNPNPPATAEKGKARSGTTMSVASKKSGVATKQQPSKSPAAAKSTERSAKKPGKKASAAAPKHMEPENSSDDGEESKVQPVGKNKKPLSKCSKTYSPCFSHDRREEAQEGRCYVDD